MATVKVQQGDTLSGIAQRAGVKTSDISGFRSGDPNLIFPGENLSINREVPAQVIGTQQQATFPSQNQRNTLSNKVISDTQPQEIAEQKEIESPELDERSQELIRDVEQRRDILNELGFSNLVDSVRDLEERRAEFRQDTERDLDIESKTQDLTDINSRIERRQLESRREREAIRQEPGTTISQKNTRIQELDRVNARELADLSVVQSVRNNDLKTAQLLSDRRVELEFEDDIRELEIRQLFFEKNEAIFSELEKRQFAEIQAEKKEEIAQEKARQKAFAAQKLAMIEQLQEGGASNDVIVRASQANSENELFSVPGTAEAGLTIEPVQPFEDFKVSDEAKELAKQYRAQGLFTVTDEVMESILRQRYQDKITRTPVTLGKMTLSMERDLSQASLLDADTYTQSFFLNSSNKFKRFYKQGISLGEFTGQESLFEMQEIERILSEDEQQTTSTSTSTVSGDKKQTKKGRSL